MAVPVGNAAKLKSSWHLITEPAPGRFAFAIRLALTCTLVAIFAEIYQTPDIALTVYIAFFLNKPDRTTSILMTVAMTVVVSLVIAFLLLIAHPVLDSPATRVLAMTVTSFCMLFLTSSSKLKPITSIVALVIAYALDVMGSVPAGELATRALLYAWLFVGIPALVSTVVNLLFAPSPRSIAQNQLAQCLAAAADAITRGGSSSLHELKLLVSEGDEELQSHLKLSGLEKTSSEEDIAGLKGASDCVITIFAAVELMLSDPDAMPSPPVRTAIHNTLNELASIFAAGGYPAEVSTIATDSDCSKLAVSAVEFLNSGLIQLGQGRPEKESKPNESKPAEEPSGFFLPDAFTNPVHAQFAIKTTMAAMFCYLLYSILSWPGIHTALITCYIVSLGTAAESVEKLTLRITGCLIGAGLGLLVMLRIVPHTTDIGGLAAIVFGGAFLGAWIAAGHKRIAYAGFQIAFAYFLCVIQGSSPSFDMVVARDRVIGILIGNLVSYFVTTQVWPVSVAQQIEKGLKELRHRLDSITGAADEWVRRRNAAETYAALNNIAGDLRLADYEPASLRPAQAWIDDRIHLVRQAQSLESPLLAAAELSPAQTREHLRACLAEDKPSEQCSVPDDTSSTTALAALEDLLISRITSFQKAMSNLNQAEEHG